MIKAIITDIEGTTSSIAFVKEVLFPYARANIAAFIAQETNNLSVQSLVNDVHQLLGHPLDQEALIAQLITWIDEDQKITPLKALQGLIWADGYRAGKLKGHIYADVIPQLQSWHAQGIQLYVYSSGSVFAQKLLFGHTEAGDLTPLFTGYFDTHIGNKREQAAYSNIIASIGLPANEVLFLSDIVEELDAAQAVGIHTCCLCRDTQHPLGNQHRLVNSFAEIQLNQFDI